MAIENLDKQKRAYQLFCLYQRSKGFLNSKNDKSFSLDLDKIRSKAKFSKFISNQYSNVGIFYALANKQISNTKFLRLCAFAYYTKGSKFIPQDLISQEVLEKYIVLQNFIDVFPRSFSYELDILLRERQIDYQQLLKKGINFPYALELYCAGKVSLGFILTLERSYSFLEKFDLQLSENSVQRFIWDSYYIAIKKWNTLVANDIKVNT